MSKDLIGAATVYADGSKMRMERGATANPGGISRNFERHHGRTYATTDEVPPSVEGNMLYTKDTDVVALSKINNATIIFECDTGQKYVMKGSYIENPVAIQTKSPVKWVGDSFEAM